MTHIPQPERRVVDDFDTYERDDGLLWVWDVGLVVSGAREWAWHELAGFGTGPGHEHECGEWVSCGRGCGCLRRAITSIRYDDARRTQEGTR